jgi:altronate hydrolase
MAKNLSKILKIHPKDNIVVALRDLTKGDIIKLEDDEFKLFSNVAAKHKFSIENLNIGDSVYMYGVVVGKVKKTISKGEHISTYNIIHETEDYVVSKSNNQDKWVRPNIEKFSNSTFLGYHRGDGTVGTENNWLVIPLVF